MEITRTSEHGTFTVGDRVRSYDFEPMPDRGDCFVEGKVIGFTQAGLMEILVDRDVFGGRESQGRINEIIRTSLVMYITEWTGRITHI